MKLTHPTLNVSLLFLLPAVLVSVALSPAMGQSLGIATVDTAQGQAWVGVGAQMPAELGVLVELLITALSGWLTYLLTAVAKRLGRTTGPTTVAVSAGLSVLVSLGYAVGMAIATRGETAWWQAGLHALLACLIANGLYLSRVFSGAEAVEIAAGKTAGGEPLAPEPALPEPGADGSPHTNGNEGFALGGQPLFGGGLLGAAAGAVLASPLLDTVIKGLLRGAGLPANAEMVLTVAARLGPDVLDGDPQLSEANLAVINNAVIDVLEAQT